MLSKGIWRALSQEASGRSCAQVRRRRHGLFPCLSSFGSFGGWQARLRAKAGRSVFCRACLVMIPRHGRVAEAQVRTGSTTNAAQSEQCANAAPGCLPPELAPVTGTRCACAGEDAWSG